MDLSRRDFLRTPTRAAAVTAIGGLIGLGATLGPATVRAQELRIKDAKAVPSVCPCCAVGCATLVHAVNGRIINIEGDPRSPHNEGTLCLKEAAIYQLHINPNRPTQVLHRALAATAWEVWDLEGTMDRVAELVKKTGDETFVKRFPDGKLVNSSAPIGGAAPVWRGPGVCHPMPSLLRRSRPPTSGLADSGGR